MRRLPVIALTLLASAGTISAQAPVSQTPQATFKAGVDLVTVSVAVRTENGRVVRDLQRSDFTVMDSGSPAPIKDFYVGDSPISLAILLDISGSMAVGGNMGRAREAVGVATMNLRAQADEAALFTAPLILRARGGTPLLDLASVDEPGHGWRLEDVRRIPLAEDVLVLGEHRRSGPG